MPGRQTDIDAYTRSQAKADLLRFITCGSVDDGKSTLIGRLLYESDFLLDDQLESLKSESARIGTQNGKLDFALLVDGLSAEREQGITIDVAYRFFTTDKRKFIVADTPGHEQYTRNMATGASTADVAIVLADVFRSRDVLPQTRRHTHICSMLGIRHLVLAVNKMDLVGYEEQIFQSFAEKYRGFAQKLGVSNIHCIPISALVGDNVVTESPRMPWYRGPSLLSFLEHIDFQENSADAWFRMPVQWVNRPHSDFRGFSGTIVSGSVGPGDKIKVMPSAQDAVVERIMTQDGELLRAIKDQSVTFVLDREIDISRGDVLCSAENPAPVSDQFAAHVLWMASYELVPGRSYLLKLGTTTSQATITSIRYKIDIETADHVAAKALTINEIGLCHLYLDKPIVYETYAKNRDLGGFILIDRMTNQTAGMGLIENSLQRADNIPWQLLEITRDARAVQKGQRPAVIWLTGLSGAGKSTVASALEKRLFDLGKHTYVLDGDNVRHGLNRDLGFSEADRVENIRRVAEVAQLMADAGLLVLVSFISPFRADRDMARLLLQDCNFVEVFIDAPLELCEIRDPKGLYRKARRGEITNFTGLDSPYEAPERPDLVLDTSALTPEQGVEKLLAYLADMRLIDIAPGSR